MNISTSASNVIRFGAAKKENPPACCQSGNHSGNQPLANLYETEIAKDAGVNTHPDVKKAISKAPGRFLFVSGPSGVGKGTILNALFADPAIKDKLTQALSYKTRPPRPGEENSRDSRHLSEAEFLQRKQNHELFQWAKYDGHWYTSMVSDITDKLNQGKTVIFELIPAIALKIKEQFPDKISTVFIAPPEPMEETLRSRLIQRGTNDDASIAHRLQKAIDEVRLAPQFDHVVVSKTGGIPEAVDEMKTIINNAATKPKSRILQFLKRFCWKPGSAA